jgi:hypothetical protein
VVVLATVIKDDPDLEVRAVVSAVVIKDDPDPADLRLVFDAWSAGSDLWESVIR